MVLKLHLVTPSGDRAPQQPHGTCGRGSQCHYPEDGANVSGLGSGAKLLAVRLPVTIKIPSPIPGECSEISPLPILVHSVPIGVQAAQAQHEDIAAIIVVTGHQITGETLKHYRSPIGGQNWL